MGNECEVFPLLGVHFVLTGEISNIDDISLEQLVLRGVFPIVFSAVTLVAMFAVLLRLDVALAFVSLAVAPLMYGWLRFYTRRMQPVAARGKESDAALMQYMQEVIGSILLVKTHVRESFEHDGPARPTLNIWRV